jgi:hypothetical protein
LFFRGCSDIRLPSRSGRSRTRAPAEAFLNHARAIHHRRSAGGGAHINLLGALLYRKSHHSLGGMASKPELNLVEIAMFGSLACRLLPYIADFAREPLRKLFQNSEIVFRRGWHAHQFVGTLLVQVHGANSERQIEHFGHLFGSTGPRCKNSSFHFVDNPPAPDPNAENTSILRRAWGESVE